MGDLNDLGIDPSRGMQASELPSLVYMASIPMELPMMALRALVPLPQTVKGDFAFGIHLELSVIPPNPVPVPFPVLFLGFADTSLAEMLAQGTRMSMPGAAPDGGDAKVAVCGSPATAASKKCTGFHIPVSGGVLRSFGDAELLMGSTSVSIGGHHAVRLGEVAMSCSFVPVPSPTTRVFSLRNVLTGGMSVIDPRAALAFVIGELLEAIFGELLENTGLKEIPRAFAAAYAKRVTETAIAASLGEAEWTDIFTADVYEAAEDVVLDWKVR